MCQMTIGYDELVKKSKRPELKLNHQILLDEHKYMEPITHMIYPAD